MREKGRLRRLGPAEVSTAQGLPSSAYSPEARGRSERMLGTLQDRPAKDLALAGSHTGIAAANDFILEVYLPRHNARFVTPAVEENAFVAVGSALLAETLSIGEKRVMARPRQYGCVWQSSAAPAHQYSASPLRQGAGQGREYPNGTLAVFKGPRRIVDYSAQGGGANRDPDHPQGDAVLAIVKAWPGNPSACYAFAARAILDRGCARRGRVEARRD